MGKLPSVFESRDQDPRIPDSPLLQDPLPRCNFPFCENEVLETRFCSEHGGPEPAPIVVRRKHLRRLRGEISLLLDCATCRTLGPPARRCHTCEVHRGLAAVRGGIVKRLGFLDDARELLSFIGVDSEALRGEIIS